MSETPKLRLLQYIKAKGMSVHGFEMAASLSSGYLKQLRHCPSAAKLAQILEAFPDLNRSWLLTGEGDMLTNAAGNDTAPAPTPEQQPSPAALSGKPHTVPLVPAYAAAGPQPGIDDIGVLSSQCPHVFSPHPAAEIAIEITGSSMAPDFPPGCRVFATRLPYLDNIRRGDVYVVETSEGAVIKRLTLSDGGRYVTAESINPDYAPYRIPRSAIRSVWRVLCHIVYQ